MHSVVFDVEVKPDWEGDQQQELDQLATMLKSIPGFVRAAWATEGTRGISWIVFDSEAAARNVAANASMPPTASVTVRGVNVYEIVGEA